MNSTEISGEGYARVIREGIQKIALHGFANPGTGEVFGSSRKVGYVVKIHTDGDLVGTVDVQEYGMGQDMGDENSYAGYHEGVYLTAIQDNATGLLTVPCLYSEVMIATDAAMRREYVVMYAHASSIRLETFQTASVGAVEREEYDGKTALDDLEETGNRALTSYSAKEGDVYAETEAADADGKNSTLTVRPESVTIGSEDGSDTSEATISATGLNVSVSGGAGSNELEMTADGTTVTSDNLKLGSDSATEPAVLGVQLADILSDLVGAISQITTTTSLGPQPVINIVQFVQLKAKIAGFKAAAQAGTGDAGFLSQAVKVK